MHSFQFPSRKGIKIGCHLRRTAPAKHNHSPPQARLAVSFFQPSSLQAWRPWPWLSWPCMESHAESLHWWKRAGQTGEQDAPCPTMIQPEAQQAVSSKCTFNLCSQPLISGVHSSCLHSHSGSSSDDRLSGGPLTHVVQKARGRKTPTGERQPMLSGAWWKPLWPAILQTGNYEGVSASQELLGEVNPSAAIGKKTNMFSESQGFCSVLFCMVLFCVFLAMHAFYRIHVIHREMGHS